jgi:hypothetical protein
MGFAEFADAPRHLWEQIAGLKFQIILVYVGHIYF